jgi:C-terminal processing protease CtpA/Prc
MSLGPYEWDDPIVVLSGATTGAFASEELAGNIGNRVLERFRVTLDYAGRRVFLEPGARYRERDHLTRCGARFVRLGDRVVVADVLEGSVAERAGVLAGDELLALDGRAAATLDLPELVARLDDGEPESSVRMTLRRDGRDLRVRFRLRELVR